MAKEIKKKVVTAPIDAEPVEDKPEEEEEIAADAEPAEDTPEGESEEEEEAPNSEIERDFDAEIAEEEGHGKPDPAKAGKAFKKRKEKREGEEDDAPEEGEEEEADEDRPLTQKDLAEVEARIEKKHQKRQALTIAKTYAGSDKEAELIVAKWNNRTFPEGLPLEQQIEEMYAVVNSKKLIGERNEALRALKTKRGVSNNAAGTHEAPKGPAKKVVISPADLQAIVAAGFVLNSKAGRYEKKLPDGSILIRDPKTGLAKRFLTAPKS